MSKDSENKEDAQEHPHKGKFIKERYMKCPYVDKKCTWKLSSNHAKGHEYLNDSCYLSGSFNLECP
jgi:hypothetical protein